METLKEVILRGFTFNTGFQEKYSTFYLTSSRDDFGRIHCSNKLQLFALFTNGNILLCIIFRLAIVIRSIDVYDLKSGRRLRFVEVSKYFIKKILSRFRLKAMAVRESHSSNSRTEPMSSKRDNDQKVPYVKNTQNRSSKNWTTRFRRKLHGKNQFKQVPAVCIKVSQDSSRKFLDLT